MLGALVNKCIEGNRKYQRQEKDIRYCSIIKSENQGSCQHLGEMVEISIAGASVNRYRCNITNVLKS